MTTPLPARAENKKPALTTVNMAKPLALASTCLGITCNDKMNNTVVLRMRVTYAVEPIVAAVDERRYYTSCQKVIHRTFDIARSHINAAFSHSFGRGLGSGELNFMVVEKEGLQLD